MWVRSQDKETLIDCSGFMLFTGISQIESNCMINCRDNLNSAIMGKSGNALYYLGIYPTKERALEELYYIEQSVVNFLPMNPDQYGMIYEMSVE